MSLPELIRQACVLEATARKLGNVHPRAAFVDLCYADFVTAADAIAPVLGHVTAQPLGERILAAVRATRALTGSNVNLGIVLLLAPLSQCDAWADLSKLLAETTVGDAAAVYEAIWHAQPGGLGTADEADVSTSPRITLTAAMQLAADRDLIARQYATSFAFVRSGAGLLTRRLQPDSAWQNSVRRWPYWELATLELQLRWLAEVGDTLISRKLGAEVADEARRRAQAVLNAGWPQTSTGWDLWDGFDAWLRADGHRRNPGATADLIAASWFAALRWEGASGPTPTELDEHVNQIHHH